MTSSKNLIAHEAAPQQPRPRETPVPDGAVESSPDLLLVLDGAASIREISPSVSRFLAYRRGELLGTSFLNILCPDDGPVLHSLLSGDREDSQEPRRACLRARRADGVWRTLEVLAHTVRGPDYQPLLVVEACDTSANQSAIAPEPPPMQLGGQLGGPASDDDQYRSDDGLSPDLVERAGAHGETVLVALDDRRVSRYACSIMRRLGYAVLEAMSPADAEGFARVHKGAIDLLLTDLATPRVRGREFVRLMQAIRPQLRSLFLSCQRYGSLAERRVFESGARLLHDPFTPEELAHAVRRALEGTKE